MAEQDVFERRLRSALARRVADAPREFDAMAFARAVAAAEPRGSGRAAAITKALGGRAWDRSRWWSALVPSGDRRPVLQLAWIVVVVGLLLAATASAVIVGSELLRRTSELSVVPPPMVAPSPSPSPSPTATPAMLPPLEFAPIGEPTVSETALGTITWQVYEGGVGALTGTPHGPVGLINNDLRWLSGEGTWAGLALPWEASPLTWTGDALFTHGAGLPRRLLRDGGGWAVGEALDVPDVVRPVEQIATGPRGTIVFGEIDFAIARDGRHFVATTRPPVGLDPVEPFVLATADGFVALAATSQAWDFGAFEPVPWFTADGTAWEPASASSPFGEEAWIDSIAGWDGRFVAVGHVGASRGPWTAWVSGDGIAWDRLTVLGDLGASLREDGEWPFVGVTAGDAGWVIYAKDGSAWASTDARTWEPLVDWPGVRGMGWSPPGVVLAGDTIVGVGYRGLIVGTIERPGGDGG